MPGIMTPHYFGTGGGQNKKHKILLEKSSKVQPERKEGEQRRGGDERRAEKGRGRGTERRKWGKESRGEERREGER